MAKTFLTLSTLKANLVDFLPDEQRPFANTGTYDFLCESLLALLQSPAIVRESRQADYAHAKEQFLHLCATAMPPQKCWQKRCPGDTHG
jgi:hypothetical protein